LIVNKYCEGKMKRYKMKKNMKLVIYEEFN
jgi:hypothetical protein